MADPALEFQKLIRDRLTASPDVLDLIEASAILDRHRRPELEREILIGEGQTVFRRFASTTYADLHIWVKEAGLTSSKAIAGAIADALDADAEDGVILLDGFVCHELSINQSRFLRDPAGHYSHGIVSVSAIMRERG